MPTLFTQTDTRVQYIISNIQILTFTVPATVFTVFLQHMSLSLPLVRDFRALFSTIALQPCLVFIVCRPLAFAANRDMNGKGGTECKVDFRGSDKRQKVNGKVQPTQINTDLNKFSRRILKKKTRPV